MAKAEKKVIPKEPENKLTEKQKHEMANLERWIKICEENGEKERAELYAQRLANYTK